MSYFITDTDYNALISRVSKLERQSDNIVTSITNIAEGLDNQITSTDTILIEVKETSQTNTSALMMLKKYWYVVVGVVVLLGYLLFKGKEKGKNKR